MRKILLIAYHYHPDLEVGSQRTIKFAKYLPQFGWQPHVLSVRACHYHQRDNAPLGFECPVYRTAKWPSPYDVYQMLAGFRRRLLPRSDEAKKTGSQITPPASSDSSAQIPLWKRSLNTLLTTPDVHIGWFFPAIVAAVRLIRRHRFDVIYSSFPPTTCHLVGLTASALTGTPWVADFRDPWFSPEYHHPGALDLPNKFDKVWEKKAVRRASLILTVTEEWREHLMEMYHPLLERKCHTIVNGFDQEDFRAVPRNGVRDTTRRITFLHAGTLYYGRNPHDFLVAVGQLLADGLIGENDVQITFLGNVEIESSRLEKVIADYRLDRVVVFEPPIGREACLGRVVKADVLILMQSSMAPAQIPAKTYEYLATGNQILALVNSGATYNLLSEFEEVSIANPENVEQIKGCIMNIVTKTRTGRRQPGSNDSKRQDLSKLNLTRRFSALLDDLVMTR